jgi:hypothetical protein
MVRRESNFEQKVSLRGIGNMIGEDDSALMRNYTSTCACKS